MSDAGRIALIVPLEPYVGPELTTLVFGLVERGWDAHVVIESAIPRRNVRFPGIDAVSNARRLHLGTPVQGRPRRGSSSAQLHSLDPRLVHFLSADHALGLSGATRATSKIVATVSAADASVPGLDVPDYYWPLWQRADSLHFPDDAVLSRATRRGLPRDKPRAVIPPLVDPNSYHPNGRRPDAAQSLRVVCAGSLEWTGGYEHGLHALALAAQRGVSCQCRVVGDGPHQTALLFARHQLGLDGIVSFEPAASPQALQEHLAWADVFMAPTVVDGLPDRVIEAAAMGLCLVLGDPGPLGELKPDESVAVIVPRRDPDALADAMAEVAADPARRARMGLAARAWALERFQVDEHLGRMDELYRQTLAAGN